MYAISGLFSYISSIFRQPEPELSVEDAAEILTSDVKDLEEPHVGPHIPGKLLNDEYNLSTTVGRISGKNGENFIIDNLYEFSPDSQELALGAKVSYQRLISEGNIIIYNVNVITNDWDTVAQKESIVTTRVMICKVEKREKRHLFLSPGEIKVDIDKVCTEFIPCVGDWLEIEVKYEVNEDSIDLSGKVLEVDRISPVRPHIEAGKISGWDSVSGTGSVNRKVFFDKNSLSCGYVPVVGDQVVLEIIESNQNQFNWRALKVLPEFMRNLHLQENTIIEKLEENHPGLEISDCQLNFNKLGESKQFKIDLINNSEKTFTLLNIVISEKASSLSFPADIPENQDIKPGNCLSVNLWCVAKTMGTSNEFLVLRFQTFTIGKCININVNVDNKRGETYQKTPLRSFNHSYNNNKELIRGQKQFNTRFQAARLPEYPVPKKLLDVVTKHLGETSPINLIDELKFVKPCLFTNLNPMNYEEKFHTLLHMDELANIICIKQYDQERASFLENGEFLMLEIDNLAERRPSIVLGDRIMASDPLQLSNQEYEGNVFRVGARHVFLKFSSLFHDTYKGEDYSIRVVSGRSSYKRQHHAIHLVARNLGKDWLFPTRRIEKEPQVRFVYESYCDNNKPTGPISTEKKPSAVDLIRKARLMKQLEKFEGFLVDQDGNKASCESSKLEWYNPDLNRKQKDAVINILKGVSRPLPYVIFGPPGTGKTVTVIESVFQILRLIPQCRILVAAPSNSAADLIALRLIDFGVLKPGDLVRLVSVNYAIGEHIPPKLLPFCATGSMAREGTADDNVLAQNGMTLDCSRSVLGRHKVTVSTCSSSGTLHMMAFPRGHFTHIFVDEAGQAAEPEVMIPISFLDKTCGQIVLAGDPMQLGPVILSNIARDCGLNESYLERLINRFPYVRDVEGFPESEGYDPRLVTKLLHNYRSLSVILNLFSAMFYHGDLISTISNRNSKEALLLNSLAPILPKTKDDGIPSIVFHGVEGENYQTSDSPSWYNPHEAAQVFYYVNEFYRLGLKAESIGIITPYNKQVREIRQLLREAEFSLPKVGTVEDFQGQEFDVILLSTVRSSRDYVSRDVEHSLGFVSSPRRLNVAISRPKVLLVVIGNPTLLRYDTYWRSVIEYSVENGACIGCNF